MFKEYDQMVIYKTQCFCKSKNLILRKISTTDDTKYMGRISIFFNHSHNVELGAQNGCRISDLELKYF